MTKYQVYNEYMQDWQVWDVEDDELTDLFCDYVRVEEDSLRDSYEQTYHHFAFAEIGSHVIHYVTIEQVVYEVWDKYDYEYYTENDFTIKIPGEKFEHPPFDEDFADGYINIDGAGP